MFARNLNPFRMIIVALARRGTTVTEHRTDGPRPLLELLEMAGEI